MAVGETERAEDIFFGLCSILQDFHDEIAGIKFFVRPDERRKLSNLRQVLRRFKRQIDPNHYREWKSQFTSISLLNITMQDLTESFKYLMGVYDRLISYKSIEGKFRHGPFTVINTYGYREDEYESILKVLDKAADLIGQSGFGKVLYGDVEFTTGTSSSGSYNDRSDTIRLNVLSNYRYDNVYTLVHEFGHRYWQKVLTSSAKDDYEGDFSGRAGYLT